MLSRWPIERSWKLLLPHESRTRHQRRTATAAEVLVRGLKVRVYGVHLETPGGATDAAREDQMRTVLGDAARFDGPVVIAGDFNSYGIGVYLTRHGYRWLTKLIDPTISIFTWDHIFVRRLAPARAGSVGVVRECPWRERPPSGMGRRRAGGVKQGRRGRPAGGTTDRAPLRVFTPGTRDTPLRLRITEV